MARELTSWGKTWFSTTASASFSEWLAMRPRASAALFWMETVGSSRRGRNCFMTPNWLRLSMFCGFEAKSATY